MAPGNVEAVDGATLAKVQDEAAAGIKVIAHDRLIRDAPTRGIDAGASFQTCGSMNEVAGQGRDGVMIGSEMPEHPGFCDRNHLRNEGRIGGELSRAEVRQERIMAFVPQGEGKAA